MPLLVKFALLLGLLAAPIMARPQTLGIYGVWGAFRTGNGCHAKAEPIRATPAAAGIRPFAAVGYWPDRSIGGQLHIRLGREKRAGSSILLRIDGRSFRLAGGGRDAWAPDPRADAEILTAMRTGVDMTVQSRSVSGRRIRESYRLRGAASAMDAAAMACVRKS